MAAQAQQRACLFAVDAGSPAGLVRLRVREGVTVDGFSAAEPGLPCLTGPQGDGRLPALRRAGDVADRNIDGYRTWR